MTEPTYRFIKACSTDKLSKEYTNICNILILYGKECNVKCFFGHTIIIIKCMKKSVCTRPLQNVNHLLWTNLGGVIYDICWLFLLCQDRSSVFEDSFKNNLFVSVVHINLGCWFVMGLMLPLTLPSYAIRKFLYKRGTLMMFHWGYWRPRTQQP